jgi:putative ABC transport system permease protein
MEIFLQDLRFALRSLRRTPGFTAVVVAVLALGIGVNTMIFSMVYGVMLRPWPLPQFERVMGVRESNKEKDIQRESVSWLNYHDIRENAKSFESLGGFYDIGAQVTIGEEPEQLEAAVITAGLLPSLGVQPHMGRNFTPEENIFEKNWETVLISDRLWKRRFGARPDVLGGTLKINGRVRTIVGVMPAGFQWPENEDLWIPMAIDPKEAERRADHLVTVTGRLKPGVTPKQAQAELDAIYARLKQDHAEAMKGWTVRVRPYADDWRQEIVVMMWIMSMAVAFVLLIACANVANLMLARAAARKRELSVRLALGATRARVVRQLLTESLLLAGAGAVLGTLLAHAGNRMWISMIPTDIGMPFFLRFDIDLPVLLFTIGVGAAAALVFGLLPAVQASDTKLSEAIREGSSQAGASRSRGRLRSGLVVAEVALSLTLLVASGLMVRSLFSMLNSDKLIRAEGVISARFFLPIATWKTDSSRTEWTQKVLPLVRNLPGVSHASHVNVLPLGRNSWGTRLVGETGTRTDPERPLRANFTECSPGYFATMGIPVKSGRDFNDSDTPTSESVVIVNQTLANTLWPKEDPLGKRIKTITDERKRSWRTVVGVVADIPQTLEDTDAVLQSIFVPHTQEPDQSLIWVLHTTGDPRGVLTPLRQLMRQHAPDVPLTEVRTMHEAIHFGVWTQRLFGTLMAVFAVLALIIAGVGLYGVMAYSVAQRTQEIGVRMALGAQARDVVGMVVGQALRLTLLGIGIGFAAAFALTRMMESVLFGVSATDPPTYAVVITILALSSVLAAWVPAHRATRVDPMRVLRCD